MTKEITAVREHFYDDPEYFNQWIVDIVEDNSATTGYGQPDGTAGRVFGFSSKENAEAAEALYLAKNVAKDLGVETSAGKPTCGDCEIQPRCGSIDHEDSDSGNCMSFKPKILVEEKIKESNPKYDAGIKKAPLHCIPMGPIFELGLAMFEGNRKYGRHNYRAVGVRASVYYDAAMGHIVDWWEGEDIDPDSGVHHLIKAMACLLVVRDSQLMGNFNDDRPLKYTNGLKGRSGLMKEVAEIVKKYPDCAEPFLEINKEAERK